MVLYLAFLLPELKGIQTVSYHPIEESPVQKPETKTPKITEMYPTDVVFSVIPKNPEHEKFCDVCKQEINSGSCVVSVPKMFCEQRNKLDYLLNIYCLDCGSTAQTARERHEEYMEASRRG